MKPNPICITKRKLFFENEGEREGERDTEKGLMKSRIQTCVAYFSSALCLCLCLSFLFWSLCLCFVCLCSLFLYLPSSFFSSLVLLFFFSCAWLSLFIEKFQRNCSLIFSQLINLWSNLRQFFSPQLPILCSAVPTIQLFCSFYSFRPTLNSLVSAGDISTFQLFGLTFLVFWLCHFPFPISLFCFTCLVFIFSFS